jgi:hypothetical protein
MVAEVTVRHRGLLQPAIVLLLCIAAQVTSVAQVGHTDTPERPSKYSLDDVLICIESDPPMHIRELEGRVSGRKKLTIAGSTGQVLKRIATTKGDTLQEFGPVLTDKDIVGLLDELYRARFFESRGSYLRGAGATLDPDTRRVHETESRTADALRYRLCVLIRDYQKCVEIKFGSAPDELERVAHRLLDLWDAQ